MSGEVSDFLGGLADDAVDLVKARYTRDATIGSNASKNQSSVGTPANQPMAATNAPPGSGLDLPPWALWVFGGSVLLLIGAWTFKALKS